MSCFRAYYRGHAHTEPAPDRARHNDVDTEKGALTIDNDKPITERSSIGDWLRHPVGGPIFRCLLAQAANEFTVEQATLLLTRSSLMSNYTEHLCLRGRSVQRRLKCNQYPCKYGFTSCASRRKR
jgi:hypothetical protein